MSGVLSFVWKYVGMAEVPAFVRAAAGLGGGARSRFACSCPTSLADLRIPISIIVMTRVLAFGGLLGVRVAAPRALGAGACSRRRSGPEAASRGRPAVLLVGAGAAGVMAVREIRSRGEHDMDLRGFVDDDPLKQGAVINGLKVLGADRGAAARSCRRWGSTQVIITIADAPAGAAAAHRQDLRGDPGAGADDPGDVRPAAGAGVDQRSCARCGSRTCCTARRCRSRSTTSSAFLGGKVVMVTGAGGSIGVGAGAAGGALRAVAAAARGAGGAGALRGGPRAARRVARARHRAGGGRRGRPGADARGLPGAPAAGGGARGGAQARAADGDERRRRR